jgi:hypothetical protein
MIFVALVDLLANGDAEVLGVGRGGEECSGPERSTPAKITRRAKPVEGEIISTRTRGRSWPGRT